MRGSRIAFPFIAVLAATSAVGACSSSKGAKARNPAPCPNVLVLNEAARSIEFNGDAALENIAYTGEILDVSFTCRYFDDEPISGSVDIEFAFGQGPKGQIGPKDYKYFVAVTRSDLEVIAKKEFYTRAEFKDGRSVVRVSEEIDKLVIPRKSDKTSGTNFEIVVGFALSREQAIFNRSGKSLKFPDLPSR